MARRKPKDENEMAFGVRAFTEKMAGDAPSKKEKIVDPAVSDAARALSKLGAHLGGQARAESLSAKRRRDIAKKAAQARWNSPKNNPR